MKKLLIIILLVAAVYPYASNYYREHYENRGSANYDNITDLVKDLNSSLPRQQGLLNFTGAVVATGSIILLVSDNFAGGGEITKNEAQDRINTWTPFLIDKTCRDKVLSGALENGLVNNVYYQFKAANGNINYGKVVVAPEMCW
ncbi:hypothetical protein KRX19_06370 [Cardiobacteriaceae bacterium TAE3-ERU3]|nr:hypothetical protein [Cardiobacteriaceae bacterium TAE3-ERU3]